MSLVSVRSLTKACRSRRTTGGNFTRPTTPSAKAFRKAYFDEVPEESFDSIYNVNAAGPYWMTFAFLPLLEKWKESPGGTKFAPQVIITSSMNGWTKVRLSRLQTH